MEIIMPAAGLSTRFPNMRPKYTLTTFDGKMMFEKAIAPFVGVHPITIGVLAENEAKHPISSYVQQEYGDAVKILILPNRTAGPADTVYQMLKQLDFNEQEILIKDCDSFFNHQYQEGNYVCLSSIADHDVLRRLASKSFVVSNNQGIITSVVEKQVVSDKFCVGGYKFESADLFVQAFEQLQQANVKEIFVSHIIEECLDNNVIFKESIVTDYVDVGTADEWFDYNDQSVIFCDIDGTIIKAQSKHAYDEEPIPLEKNITRLQHLLAQGSEIIFTTARPRKFHDKIIEMLVALGFKNFQLISGLPNTKRILINDYNEANPYPRAMAVNIKRDSDTLGDYL
jgi:hypothetical protein